MSAKIRDYRDIVVHLLSREIAASIKKGDEFSCGMLSVKCGMLSVEC